MKKLVIPLLGLIFLAIFSFRLLSVSNLDIPEEKTITLRGHITKQPYLKGSNQIIYLENIMLISERFPGFSYGDHLEVVGTFEKRVINPFLISYSAKFPSISLLEEKEKMSVGVSLKKILFNTRSRFERVINEVLSEPEASLLAGILLGIKKSMPDDFYESLRKTGTLHIIVASGYNVSVVSGFIVFLLAGALGRKKAVALGFTAIVFYCLMVGADPPVVRAAIMAALGFLAVIAGRLKIGFLTLIAAAGLMILVSPLILFDLGFQLSFLATAGILTIYPFLKRKKMFKIPLLGTELATTLSAQIAVTPLILFRFGEVSFLSPLINALVLPLVPIVMNIGALMVFAGLLFLPLAKLLGLFLWPILHIFVVLVEFFSNFGFAKMVVEDLSFWWVIGYYFVLTGFIFKNREKWEEETRSF
ncbi:ComEC/Rec2 family competence protein [Patescibacteria group bacterium]|nr:ComEC/Rec2 family competence protein [Patescibacteria group bacterium]